ncbi:uncharacterized protein LOC125496398 [Beta vulgaris subsp. vulgaris]|uniref:uncharacterized protein LOC125496398 n=1 Tax=Beta vulgaris subsp. vulgaris TaxID=3555 RepID=UPI002546DC1C|nr:uncharacterized protein LOC125496398 [Beta vulgaris subsp. vulgaris]
MSQMSAYAKFLKEILSNKRKLEDELITLPYQVSALVQCAMPKKQRDPGSFTLPVKIGDLEPKGALADLGASVILMPLSIAKHLNLPLYPTPKTIQLVDRTVRVSHDLFFGFSGSFLRQKWKEIDRILRLSTLDL